MIPFFRKTEQILRAIKDETSPAESCNCSSPGGGIDENSNDCAVAQAHGMRRVNSAKQLSYLLGADLGRPALGYLIAFASNSRCGIQDHDVAIYQTIE